MNKPLQRDALRLIQDIVREAKGSPLDRESVRRVQAVLQAVAAGNVPRSSTDAGYSVREATILFADLRGFSAIASAFPPETVLGILNRWLGAMAEIIVRHFGTIDKFMGDAVMAIFHGAPAMPRDHARRALLCAVEMQLAAHELRQQHAGRGMPGIYMGIGVNTGRVMTGLIGSDAYRAYTAIGDEVNLAARMEALSLRGQILVSDSTYAHCQDFIQVGEAVEVYVKGRPERVRVRDVHGIPSLGKSVPRQDARSSPRVPVRLDLEYWEVRGKSVRGDGAFGVIRDIGYHGLLAELARPAPLYGELKLAFDLPPIAFRADDIYARIVSAREQNARFLAGIEFTSVDAETNERIAFFVQMLLQGDYAP
jgi:adenylate cyclase